MTDEDLLEELRTKKHVLEQLQESEGWKVLAHYYKSLQIGRRNAVLSSATDSLDDLIGMANTKAELAGMDLMMTIPKVLWEEADLEEHTLIAEMNDADQSNDE